MSRATLKMLYAKDAKRQRRKRRDVGQQKLMKTAVAVTVIQVRNSDGKTSAWYIYRCVHCHEYEGQHADGCCLFLPTKFQEMTPEEDAAAFPPEPTTVWWPMKQQVAKSTNTTALPFRGASYTTTILDEVQDL